MHFTVCDIYFNKKKGLKEMKNINKLITIEENWKRGSGIKLFPIKSTRPKIVKSKTLKNKNISCYLKCNDFLKIHEKFFIKIYLNARNQLENMTESNAYYCL